MAAEIDEKKIQEMVARGMPQQMVLTSTQKVEQPYTSSEIGASDPNATRQRVKERDIKEYNENYFKAADTKDRQVVYLDGELHELLIDILHVATKRKTNISSYVVNVVRQHLEDNKSIINTMYNKRLKNPL